MPIFDTNIMIDYLSGYEKARVEIEAVKKPTISQITALEVLVGTPPEYGEATRQFLKTCHIVPIDSEIGEQAVQYRREKKLKLLDAIILATAFCRNTILITRDETFSGAGPLVRLPYKKS